MRFGLVVLVGCGASPAPPPPVTKPPPPIDEGARRAELATAQNVRLDEQATAFAAICESKEPTPRCAPTCYAGEIADARAGKHIKGAVEIEHRVCSREEGVYVLLDEGVNLSVRRVPGFPKPHAKGTWQADVEAVVRKSLEPEIARIDVITVSGAWKPFTHPLTREAMRCVGVSHYTRAQRRPLDHCGGQGQTACEAGRSDAAHGLNVVRFRLAEARRLQAEHKDDACQQAALEAIAVARGMPRWRQYMSLNTTNWKPMPRYRTRFDGVLDEDTLFTTTIALGVEAEKVYADCGGGRPKTTATQEQSFHTCW